jgi:hypothetical protein
MPGEASSAIVSLMEMGWAPASVGGNGAAFELECDGGAPRVELAARENDGISVTLLWAPATNLLAVVVVDSRMCESFELVVDPDDRPLEVFYHPYAAAAVRGLDLAGSRAGSELAVDAGRLLQGGGR